MSIFFVPKVNMHSIGTLIDFESNIKFNIVRLFSDGWKSFQVQQLLQMMCRIEFSLSLSLVFFIHKFRMKINEK